MNTQYQFPTETIDLPSGGKFYDETHPLHSGKVDLKYMTCREEDILTSSNLIAKGLVFDKLYESLVVTPGTKIDSILTGDINAIMVASRILGYGKDYDIAVTCPSCGIGEVITVDLTNFEDRKTTGTAEQVGKHFVVTLPVSGAKVEFQLLTRGMEKAMQKDLDAYAKINSEYIPERTTFFKAIVVSVNGSTDKPSISKFVDQLLVKDAKALRDEYLAVKPDINFNFEYTCSSCSNTSSVGLPISTSFFWPDR